MKRTSTLLLALLTSFVTVWSVSAYSASCANGKALYNKVANGNPSCSNDSCHKASPSSDTNGIQVGAGNPSAIENALDTVAEMTNIDVRGTLGLSTSDIDDLAQWILFAPTCPAAAPSLAASPSNIAFGSVTNGNTSAATTVTVTNSGSGAATGMAYTNSNAALWIITSKTCGASIAAGASCTLNIAYKPGASGANDSGTYSATGTGNFSVSLSGSSPSASTPANLSVSPPSAAFGSVTVGSSSATQSFTVSNTGTTGATGIALTGTNNTEFVVSGNTCTATLAGGGNCTFNVKYTPTGTGADNATLSIAYTSGTTVNISMTGTGAAAAVAALQATPVSLAFGTATVGSTSATQSISVTNTGGATATALALANGDATHFVVSANTCGTTLAAGASCSLAVAYKPNAVGANNASLTFSYAGGTNVTVQMAGTGSAAPTPNLATTPSGGTFGTVTVGQASAPLAVTLNNTGGAAANGVTFNNSNAAEFIVSANTCGATVNAGASCAFNVTYTPTAPGADSATLTINATGGSAVVMALSGTGTSSAPQVGQLSLPAAITMSDTQVGTTSFARTVTISNLGPGPVNVLSIVSGNPAEFALGSNGCGTVQANTACTFDLTFKPAAAGTRAASVTITSNGVSSPQVLAVNGMGTAGVPPPPATVDVIEYYHAEFGHYFITYLSDEIAKLDNGTFKGWARTGRQFKAWTTQADAEMVPVCRFFTVAFAPKSSHFYTPFAPECTVVKTSSVWTYEGEVFFTKQASVDGVCPAGTVPVYRMYNNGQSGAPNHRYTTDMTVRTKMLAEGWIPEGAGTIGVIMCAAP